MILFVAVTANFFFLRIGASPTGCSITSTFFGSVDGFGVSVADWASVATGVDGAVCSHGIGSIVKEKLYEKREFSHKPERAREKIMRRKNGKESIKGACIDLF